MPMYMAVRRVRGLAWNASLPMRSQARWAEHAAFMNALAAEGFVVLGGPLGSGEEVLLVIDAVSEDAVSARIPGANRVCWKSIESNRGPSYSMAGGRDRGAMAGGARRRPAARVRPSREL